ncbi:hypothetical protein QAD02_017884 [Eretmocerus hayati]|uniref:Uncharacterized protein n=1 Tax=Eretmocerus hayati TaxID=131215 RepID=A0ACC2PI45_9HYME|nr:hypothetical protein QAD02_017884 [Eretmocerus hayati]
MEWTPNNPKIGNCQVSRLNYNNRFTGSNGGITSVRFPVLLSISQAFLSQKRSLIVGSVMDKRFLSAEYYDLNQRLIRAASFSELSTSNKLFEKCSKVETNGNLIRQHSCERIVDDRSDLSHTTLSQLTLSEEQYSKLWKSNPADRTPSYIPSKNFGWPTGKGTTKNDKQEFSYPTDYFKVPKARSLKMKSILAPPKLNIDDQRENESRNKSGDENQGKTSVSHKSEDGQSSDSTVEFKESALPLKKSAGFSFKHIRSNNSQNKPEYLLKPAEGEHLQRDTTEVSNDCSLQQRLESLSVDERKRKKKICNCRSLTVLVLLSFVVVFCGVLWNGVKISDKLCNPRFYFKDIAQDLRSHIHGQDSAVNSLIDYFEKQNERSGFEIVSLVGGIGVGKSYSAEIIKKNVEKNFKTIDLYAPIYRKEDHILSLLSICKCNLIRLENLRTDDIPDVVNFASNIAKRTETHCILILALFNTQETDLYLEKTIDLNKSVSVISEQFRKVNLQPALITFNHMNEDALEKCIKDAATHADVELTPDEIDHVKRDLLKADSGCKGASAKVQIVGKKFNSSDEL